MITLRDIITDYGLDKDELAKRLFPEAKHPNLAIARILHYSKQLTIEQLDIIADMANCKVINLVETLL